MMVLLNGYSYLISFIECFMRLMDLYRQILNVVLLLITYNLLFLLNV